MSEEPTRRAVKLRADVVIAAVLIALCAFGVARQAGWDPFGGQDLEPVEPLALGERLDPDLALPFVTGPDEPQRIADWFGEQATVIYTWSVPCPCVNALEPRMRKVYARFGRAEGVEWMAIDGEPKDTPEAIMQKMGNVHAFYRMFLDPEQRVTRRLGFDAAVQVAVLDGEGRLRYRGAVDDDYYEGEAGHLVRALETVVEGDDERAHFETPWVYGCQFNDPASCLEYEVPAPGS